MKQIQLINLCSVEGMLVYFSYAIVVQVPENVRNICMFKLSGLL